MTKQKLDVLAIGELNVDVILNNIDGFPKIGKEILAQNMTLTLGSSTAIFAANLSGLGAKVGFLGKIGKDSFGDLVIKSLKDKGVDTSMVIVEDGICTGATICLNYDEDRANVTHPGAMELLTIDDITDNQLLQAKHVHFSSVFLQPGIRNDIGNLFARAKQLGLTTSLDTQWDPAENWDFDYKTILPNVDIFLPNETELLHLTKTSNIENAFTELNQYAQNIVVKRGNKGSILRTRNGEITELPAYLNTSVVDAIGAGDSFNAGFIYKLVKGVSLKECLDFGNLTGALNTTNAGGTGAFSSKLQIIETAKNKFNVLIDI
jgi:sugar/nucleoside kinase (ribokinase family)